MISKFRLGYYDLSTSLEGGQIKIDVYTLRCQGGRGKKAAAQQLPLEHVEQKM